ncbi:hypothetical protein [Streptomyces sp. NPDC002619]|uniref:hypothetical protein n=1 Tax=Streptomyces sp. NPDC002619 TaxID=3364655 RepID=UPI0036C37475
MRRGLSDAELRMAGFQRDAVQRALAAAEEPAGRTTAATAPAAVLAAPRVRNERPVDGLCHPAASTAPPHGRALGLFANESVSLMITSRDHWGVITAGVGIVDFLIGLFLIVFGAPLVGLIGGWIEGAGREGLGKTISIGGYLAVLGVAMWFVIRSF